MALSRQPRMLIRVVLPEPDGPMKETNSPLWIVERDVVDGDDLLRAAVVDLAQVPGVRGRLARLLAWASCQSPSLRMDSSGRTRAARQAG